MALTAAWEKLQLTDTEMHQVDTLARATVRAPNAVATIYNKRLAPNLDVVSPTNFIIEIRQALEGAESDGERQIMQAFVATRFFKIGETVDATKVWELTKAARGLSPEQAEEISQLAGLPKPPE